MPGERWAYVKALLAAVPIDSLYAAADDWRAVGLGIETAWRSWTPPQGLLDQGRTVSIAAGQLLETGKAAYENLDRTRSALESYSFGSRLRDLAYEVRRLQMKMDADEKGGPLGFGSLPDSSTPPATMAGSIIRDALLQEFDARAEVYLARLHEAVNLTVSDIDSYQVGNWPKDVPVGDPDGPRPTDA